MSESRMVNRGV